MDYNYTFNKFAIMNRCLLFFIFFSFLLFSQENRSLDWEGSKINCNGDSLLYFNNSLYDESISNNNIYFEKIPINSDNVKLNFFDVNYKVVDSDDMKYVNTDALIHETNFRYHVGFQNNQKFIFLYFSPFIYSNNTLKKVVDFRFSIEEIHTLKSNSRKKSVIQSSILSSGNWYKIGVTQSGIHEIDLGFLNSTGIDVNSINPKNIRLYGNKSGVLSEGFYEIDDLKEMSIEVVGEEDQVFDSSDKVLFYGESQTIWHNQEESFSFTNNIYSDTTFYFLNFDLGPGKRVDFSAPLPSGSIIHNNVSTYDAFFSYEKELINLVNTGRQWMGESFAFNPYQVFEHSSQHIDLSEPVNLLINVAARSSIPSSFSIANNNNNITNINISSTSSSSDVFYKTNFIEQIFYPQSQNLDMQITYNNFGNSSALAWLDFFGLVYRNQLIFNGTQFSFRDTRSVGFDTVSRFIINSPNENLHVWDVTDPINSKKIEAINNNNNQEFVTTTNTLKEFVVYNGNDNFQPQFIEYVPNQNLHGQLQPDYIIITHPKFLESANRLADYHQMKNSSDVLVVTTKEIYNEFSTGSQDITGIRNFIKMFYDRSIGENDKPKNVLLFGDASFDYKNKLSGLTNFVPTFESEVSYSISSSFCTDDYFAVLEDLDGRWNGGYNNSIITDDIDVGIGRIPVNTIEEAEAFIDKIFYYDSYSVGDWKNKICFIADDADAGWESSLILHADALAEKIDTSYNQFNIDKIYIDSYQQSILSGAQRYPAAQDDLVSLVESGAFIINYVGHGGEIGWASERILELSDINSFSNFEKLPVFITATCEFTRYDDLERVSAGEYLLLNPQGGAIGLYSTSRTVGETPTYNIVNSLYDFLPNPDLNLTFGEVLMHTKNDSSLVLNSVKRRFSFFGDPNLNLAFPQHNIKTKSISLLDSLGQVIDYDTNLNSNDTIMSLSHVRVSGEIINNDSILVPFNGVLDVTLFDKAVNLFTLNNDGFLSQPFEYQLQKNIIYNGKVNVEDGLFEVEFIVPKDISYDFGKGRLSYYAEDDSFNEATGATENILIGGISDYASIDDVGPNIRLFLNDTNFVDRGYTNADPQLLALLFDDSGINTVGTGIGHDLTVVLDENTANQYILNEYYESDLNSFQSGKVIFPFSNLDDGEHILSFKAWDVHNNSSIAELRFFVTSSLELELSEVFNYPNPCTDFTQFVFEHNRPDDLLDARIDIFSLNGKLIKTLTNQQEATGFRDENLLWNISSNIEKGIYIYRLSVKSENDNSISQKTDKLIIVR